MSSVPRPLGVMLVLLVALVGGVAWGGQDARARLESGDAAWGEGERGLARQAWRAAAEATSPAVRAQAELRLLLVSGSLGLAVHGPRADRALRQCRADPWCDVALAERELLLRELGLPWSREAASAALDRAAAALPGPVLARRAWLGEVEGEALAASELDLDALGRILQRTGGLLPQGPGTWVLGLGVLGATGQGVGGGVRFVHPDLGWSADRLELEGAVTSRGAGLILARLQATGQRGLFLGGLRLQRLVQDRYVSQPSGEVARVGTERAGVAVLTLAPGLHGGGLAAWAGPLARLDLVGGTVIQGHGAAGGLQWRPGEIARHTVSGELSLLGSRHLGSRLELTWTPPAAGSGPALQLLGLWVPGSTAPAWRLPTAGGGQVLRSGPVGRFRSPALGATVLEWRQLVGSTLVVVPFAEAAWSEGLHGGAGLGLRLRLPPRPVNTLRLDVGLGDGGLGVSLGWGELF